MSRSGNQVRQNGQVVPIDPAKTPTKILPSMRSAPLRLKAVVRRLPPGLTEDEFQQTIGDEWKAGGEKVDWYTFKAGKVTKDISKPSVPGRAYFNLTKPEHLNRLSIIVRESNFADARNTAGDSCLLGPPLVEMSTYGRIPTSKARKDARQGTIDQDTEFMNFLLALTNPITRPTPIDSAGGEKDGNRPSGDVITPLIQFLRDKKASKEKSKDQTLSKSGKQAKQDGKDPKGSGEKSGSSGTKAKGNKDTAVASGTDKKSAAASKSDKPPRETIKVLNKQSANAQKNSQSQNAPANKTAAIGSENNNAPAPVERKQRKVGAEAKSLLQRDLGLGGGAGSGGRRRRGEATTSSAGSASSTPASRRQSVTSHTSAPNSTVSGDTITQPGTVGPAKAGSTNTPSLPQAPQTQVTTASSRESALVSKSGSISAVSSQSSVVSGSTVAGLAPTQAFLKHANSSQGVTEAALQATMSGYGTIKWIEVDKKKGFAYVDFVDTESLKRAIAASPIKVAQGSVVVLERKEKPAKQEKGSRGGNNVASNTLANIQITGSNATDKSSQTAASTPVASTSQPGSAGSSSRGSSHRGHRPRGNRGRGSGRNGGDKSGSSSNQQTSTANSDTKV